MCATTWSQLSKKNNTHFRKIYRFHGWVAISFRQVHATIMHERTSIIGDTISGQMIHLLEFRNIFGIISDVIVVYFNVVTAIRPQVLMVKAIGVQKLMSDFTISIAIIIGISIIL